MKHFALSAAICLALGAHEVAAETLEQRFARMEAEMQALKLQLAQQQRIIDAQQQTLSDRPPSAQDTAQAPEPPDAQAEPADHSDGAKGFGRIEFGGVVEVEAGYHSSYAGDNESDLVLAAFELGLFARVTDWVSAEGTLLYEEDEGGLDLDTAAVTIGKPEASPFYLTAGQIYVPFGVYSTQLISDPLTLAIGETRETALQAGYDRNAFSAALYGFNGSHNKQGKNHLSSWGATLAYAAETDALAWSATLGYASDLGDSDGLQDLITDNLGHNEVAHRVPAWTLGADLGFGPFHLIGEYLAAAKRFEAGAVPWQLSGAKPRAWNLEAAYGFSLLGKDAVLALAYQGTREALALELPRERWLLGISVAILDNTALAFEWARDNDYDAADGGSGESADTFTAQLAVEF